VGSDVSHETGILAGEPNPLSSCAPAIDRSEATDRPGVVLDWQAMAGLADRLATAVVADGSPDVVVGVLRGGMVPAVLLAHALGLRDVRAIDVTHTASEGVNAAKTLCPTVRNPRSLGNLHGLDVLVVDDVVGKGDTIAMATDLVRWARTSRVRTAVCAVNELNWFAMRDRDPSEALNYIAVRCRGWVIFPWERQ
jgi:hypoxanthine phosphoribosyltransferase